MTPREEHPYLHVRAHRAELARLFLAEAMNSESEDRNILIGEANRLDRSSYLYKLASTPAEVRELIAIRGAPELGLYLETIVWAGYRSRPGEPARWCREQAQKMLGNPRDMPTAKAFCEKDPAMVAKALFWAASRFDTFTPQQPYAEPIIERKAPREKRGPRATWKGATR